MRTRSIGSLVELCAIALRPIYATRSSAQSASAEKPSQYMFRSLSFHAPCGATT